MTSLLHHISVVSKQYFSEDRKLCPYTCIRYPPDSPTKHSSNTLFIALSGIARGFGQCVYRTRISAGCPSTLSSVVETTQSPHQTVCYTTYICEMSPVADVANLSGFLGAFTYLKALVDCSYASGPISSSWRAGHSIYSGGF